MVKDTIVDLPTSIRKANMSKKGTVPIVSTNITENIVKILLRDGFIESFGNIKKVTDISWSQLCDIKREGLERECIQREPF